MNNITYEEFKLKYPKIAALDPDMPEQIQITTHTIIFYINCIFNTKYIAENIPININFISNITYGNTTSNFRGITNIRKHKSNTMNSKYKSKKRKNFYFQTTLVVTNNGNSLNMKLFRNGTIQVTGSKKISFVFWVLYEILKFFKDSNCNNYAQPFYICSLDSIYKYKVVMINSIFNVGLLIDKNETFYVISSLVKQTEKKRLENKFVECIYDSIRHAGIQIKYKTGKNIISMTLFEKGNVILSGSRNYKNMLLSYIALNKLLLENYDRIRKKYIGEVNDDE